MGRGRAKAKQTKVARRLKYTTTGTDLDRLRAELSGGAPVDDDDASGDEFEDEDEGAYPGYPGDDEDEDDGEAPSRGPRR